MTSRSLFTSLSFDSFPSRPHQVCRFLKLPPINPKMDEPAGSGTMPATHFIADKGVSAADLSRYNSSIAFVSDTSLFAQATRKKSMALNEASMPLLPPLPTNHVPPTDDGGSSGAGGGEQQCCACAIF